MLLLTTASLEANDGRIVYFRPAYYYYQPCSEVVYYQHWVGSEAIPHVPQATTNQYAPQAPAPASPEQIWSAPREKPQVKEFRTSQAEPEQVKYYDAYYVAARPGPRLPTCSIAFWNLSDRPMHIRVGDKMHVVQRQQQIILDLPRHFQWQVDGRSPEPVQVAQEQTAMEIVIRR
jgi:hypothetical protein